MTPLTPRTCIDVDITDYDTVRVSVTNYLVVTYVPPYLFTYLCHSISDNKECSKRNSGGGTVTY